MLKFFIFFLGVSLVQTTDANSKVFSDQKICLATLSSLMSLEPQDFIIDNNNKSEVIYLSSKKYKYQCKVAGSRVYYSSLGSNFSTQHIEYEANNNIITITEFHDCNKLKMFMGNCTEISNKFSLQGNGSLRLIKE